MANETKTVPVDQALDSMLQWLRVYNTAREMIAMFARATDMTFEQALALIEAREKTFNQTVDARIAELEAKVRAMESGQ